MLPFWDLDASVRELERAKELGHKGFLFANQFEKFGLPHLTDPHWTGLLDAGADLDLCANFHVGFSSSVSEDGVSQADLDARGDAMMADPASFVKTSSMAFMSNINCVMDLITGGVCERNPRTQFVCVESGFGYVPFLLETMDWQWQNSGAARTYPSRLLPSEYFRRQIHATFWFETSSLALLEQFEDNVMFESDYPHPTSLTPGPCSVASNPKDHVLARFGDLPERIVRKVVHDNAARLYHLD
jgi:predicted TIM-barrel fold metal-dependent hydrolase